jgi:hypothetical protein
MFGNWFKRTALTHQHVFQLVPTLERRKSINVLQTKILALDGTIQWQQL